MAFAKGNKLREGKPNPNAGRPRKSVEEDLRQVLEVVCTQEKRQKIFTNLLDASELGDVQASRLLLSYIYGTPINGDDTARQEAADDAIENLLTQLEANLTPAIWREVERALGIGAAGKAESGEQPIVDGEV